MAHVLRYMALVVSEEAQGAYWDANPDQIDSRGEDHRYTVFQIFVEWFHRMLVGVIALPIVYNVVAMRKDRDHYGTPVERAAQFSALLVIQATAGYVTVRYDNADWTVALHLSLACIFISGLLWQHLSMRITEGGRMEVPSGTAPLLTLTGSEFTR